MQCLIVHNIIQRMISILQSHCGEVDVSTCAVDIVAINPSGLEGRDPPDFVMRRVVGSP